MDWSLLWRLCGGKVLVWGGVICREGVVCEEGVVCGRDSLW